MGISHQVLQEWAAKRRAVIASVLLAALPTAVLSQPGQPIGGEIPVNTFEKGRQDEADVAVHEEGFVVVWHSERRDGSGFGIVGRRFDADGRSLGREFPINTFTDGDQMAPAVAANMTGEFVVVWESQNQDGSGSGIFGQRFNARGHARGAEFRINTYGRSDQSRPDVAMSASGRFVVVWESEGQDGDSRGIFGQRYNRRGRALGEEFQANTFTDNGQDHGAVATDADGNFVIVWESRDQDGHLNGVFGRLFDSSGRTLGDEFRANTTTRGAQQDPDVSRNAAGAFVVVWEEENEAADAVGVFARRFKTDGRPVGREIALNTTTGLGQRDPSVALDADGNFLASWESVGQDGWGNGVIGRYDHSGRQIGPEVKVNSYVVRNQNDPAIAVSGSPTGDFVIAWESFGQESARSDFGVFARRFWGTRGILKRVVAGADVDRDRKIDVAVEVDRTAPVNYEFEIRYTNPKGPDALIVDVVPAEWQVLEVAGHKLVNGFSAGSVADGNPGLGTVTVSPVSGKRNNKSATMIEWLPDSANDRSTIKVVVESRKRRKQKSRYRPRMCGPLYLNETAGVFRLSKNGARIFERGPTLLVAVADINGNGIVGDGSGDEDGDGRTDLEEVRDAPVTDPCVSDTDADGLADGAEITQGTNPNSSDTDGDGVPDGSDSCPTDSGGGLVGIDGCPF